MPGEAPQGRIRATLTAVSVPASSLAQLDTL